jgi:hypothetical protein
MLLVKVRELLVMQCVFIRHTGNGYITMPISLHLQTGMTKEAVSARKSELAVWLREGLVRLGPT